MNYPSHWRLAYLLAFFFHLWAWLFVSLALPHLTLSLAQPEPVQEQPRAVRQRRLRVPPRPQLRKQCR